MIEDQSYTRFLQRAVASMATAGYEALLTGDGAAPWTAGWDQVLLGHGPGEATLYAFTSASGSNDESLRTRIDRLAGGLSRNGVLQSASLRLVTVVAFPPGAGEGEKRSVTKLAPSIFLSGLHPSTWSVDLATGEVRSGGRMSRPAEVRLLETAASPTGVIPDAVQGEFLRHQHSERTRAFYRLMQGRQPLITYGLVALNVLLFLLMVLSGNSAGGQPDVNTLVSFGALVPNLVLHGQWWRLFSAMFLHASIPHILFNMASLFAVGNLAERLYGSIKFLGIYLGAGLIGSLTSVGFAMASGTLNVPGVGASGAIFGVAGALVTVRFQSSEIIPKALRDRVSNTMIPLIVISLVFAYITPYVDNAAHVGGLLGGMALSFLFPLVKRLPQPHA